MEALSQSQVVGPERSEKTLMPKSEGLGLMRSKFPGCRDIDFERFIAAADGKMHGQKGALVKFEKHLQWRHSTIIGRYPSMKDMHAKLLPELKKGKFYGRGIDKQGRLICWWQQSKNDPAVRDLQTSLDAATYMSFTQEQYLDKDIGTEKDKFHHLRKDGSTPNRCIFVVDRTDNVRDLQLTFKIIGEYIDNFPERIGNMYICPTPWVYGPIWALISPLLNDKIRAMTRILRSAEEMLEFVDKEQLPTRLGGTDAYVFKGDEDDLLVLDEWKSNFPLPPSMAQDADAQVQVQQTV